MYKTARYNARTFCFTEQSNTVRHLQSSLVESTTEFSTKSIPVSTDAENTNKNHCIQSCDNRATAPNDCIS